MDLIGKSPLGGIKKNLPGIKMAQKSLVKFADKVRKKSKAVRGLAKFGGRKTSTGAFPETSRNSNMISRLPGYHTDTLSPEGLGGNASMLAVSGEQEEDLVALLLQDGEQQFSQAVKIIIDRDLYGSYEKALNRHIRKRNAEIRSICNAHYEEFIASIDSLLSVKSDLVSLRDQMLTFNQNVQETGSEMLSATNELLRYRHISNNISNSLQLLSECRFVVELITKAMEQINEQKFIAALRTLDQLKRSYLDRFSDYEFKAHLEEQIPIMLFCIRQNVKHQFDQWLLNVHSHSHKVGDLAMRRSEEILAFEHRKEIYLIRKGSAKTHAPELSSVDLTKTHSLNQSELLDQVDIDFSSVYQCLHIYDSLNIASKFVQYYKETRKNQANLVMDVSAGTSSDFVKNPRSFFAKVAGFFIIEDSVMKSGNNLLSSSELYELWEIAVSKLKMILSQHLASVDNLDAFVSIKDSVILFCRTMDRNGLDTSSLLSFLAQHCDQFEELLDHHLKKEIDTIFAVERVQPYTIKDEKEYQKYVVDCRLEHGLDDQNISSFSDPIPDYKDGVLESGSDFFPLTVPFSHLVPLLSRKIVLFIEQYFAFIRNLPIQPQVVQNALDSIVKHYIDSRMQNMLQDVSLNMSQAAQISIDCSFLQLSCDYWEEVFLSFTRVKHLYATEKDTTSFEAKKRFEQTSQLSQNRIHEMASSKIDHCLNTVNANFDWTPSSAHKNASGYAQDLITYLETSFMCLTYIPDPIIQAVHFISFKHIASSLMSDLMECKRFNIVAIWNLGQDLQVFEQFASQSQIANLTDVFIELRQYILLFLNGLEEILNASIRSSKYPLISKQKLADLLSRFKPPSMLTILPANLPKITKSIVESVISKL